MNKKDAEKQIENLKQDIARLEEIINQPEGRERAPKSCSYYVVRSTGVIGEELDVDNSIDDKCFKAGNYFNTEEEAKKSALYHILNSDYFYWFPDCPKPDKLPDGCEYYDGAEWEVECDKPKTWGYWTRRWPKN